MCYYIGSDVVLANLLEYAHGAKEKGISFVDIENYCKRIKEALVANGKNKQDYIYFGVNKRELDSDMEVYEDQFRKFQDRYYANDKINIHNFDRGLSPDVRAVMESVAKSM